MICGSSYDSEKSEGWNWVWKVGSTGERLWKADFPPEDDAEIVTMLSDGQGGAVMLLSRYEGPPSIVRVDANGKLAPETPIGSAEVLVHVLLKTRDGAYLIGGNTPAKDADASDAWLALADASGSLRWEKKFDRGKNENVYDVQEAPGGGFYCLANSGEMDKFGSGPSEVWLFKCSNEGAIEKEVIIPKGRFVTTTGGGLLITKGDELAFVCTMPQSGESDPVPGEMFTIPSLIAVYSTSLEQRWKLDFAGNHAVATPRMAIAPDGGYFLAYAGAKAPELAHISSEGKIDKTLKGKGWSFDAMMNVEYLDVDETSAYVLGFVADFMSDEDDNEHVFLGCFDLAKGKVVWQVTW